ncbi:hypothetical protein [Xenorhabdus lircayensis]|uniref:Uncharacterized protein n=1 Tax=Xenorhabdus lircayensis TaxID=2763499 RepID=A0ABS0UA51_9GAMM|nr:hypothetical protein [Xenorhabdus lircayensis]MBI6550767.1 hypothetical protein [Xenorhabdus lircayensis]
MMAMQAVSPAVTPLLLPTADVADNDPSYTVAGVIFDSVCTLDGKGAMSGLIQADGDNPTQLKRCAQKRDLKTRG